MPPKGKRKPSERDGGRADDAGIAQSLQAKRTCESTKRAYKSKLNMMRAWMAENHPDQLNKETGALQIPIMKQALFAFFGHVCQPAHQCDVEDEHSSAQPRGPLSASSVWGYRSALLDLHKCQSKPFDSDVDAELRRMLDGYEKLINDLRKRGLMKITEGKRQLKSNGYGLIAQKLLILEPEKRGQSWSTTLFAWPYFVLMWNLMSRSDSIDSIMLQHLEWSEDALVVEEQGHKGDQTGADKYGKHIYANPYKPSTCPILALAILLFCSPIRHELGQQQLFLGSDSKNRFGRILRRVVGSLSAIELHTLGCKPDEIGTHSLRKGSSTYALGQVSGPSPVSVYLRMGQSLGRLKDRYIHHGAGADQLCGRVIAGLKFDSVDFGVLPPHFAPLTCDLLTTEFWSSIVAGYNHYPIAMRSAFPFFLASVIHHEQFLRSNLSKDHPIFASRVFSNNPILPQLRGSTILCLGSSSVMDMTATGIPPHIVIAANVNKLAEEITALREESIAREVELPQKIAQTVATEIREAFVISGVAPLTIRDIDQRLHTMREAIICELNATTSQQIASVGLNGSGESIQEWRTWSWGDGRVCHFVPKDWEFPKNVTAMSMWTLWNNGDRSQHIRPYRLLSKHHDIPKTQRMRYVRAKAVMDFMASIVADLRRKSDATENELVRAAHEEMVKTLYGECAHRRVGEVACGTLYNRLTAHLRQERS